jgi:hypothetical protein
MKQQRKLSGFIRRDGKFSTNMSAIMTYSIPTEYLIDFDEVEDFFDEMTEEGNVHKPNFYETHKNFINRPNLYENFHKINPVAKFGNTLANQGFALNNFDDTVLDGDYEEVNKKEWEEDDVKIHFLDDSRTTKDTFPVISSEKSKTLRKERYFKKIPRKKSCGCW